MNASQGRRKPTKLSAEAEWEIFSAVAQGQVTQAEAARKQRVGCVDDYCDSSLCEGRGVSGVGAQGWPSNKGTQFRARSWLDEVYQVAEAVKAQAIELAILHRKAGWGSTA